MAVRALVLEGRLRRGRTTVCDSASIEAAAAPTSSPAPTAGPPNKREWMCPDCDAALRSA
ncbi:hypothetical protein [Streptomyces cyaneofuscatus]|uniref:hypothetical protein n=1 Tax=Streptomyces cyaneofuscatus TaxID=66883 RepID=UPI00343F0FE3